MSLQVSRGYLKGKSIRSIKLLPDKALVSPKMPKKHFNKSSKYPKLLNNIDDIEMEDISYTRNIRNINKPQYTKQVRPTSSMTRCILFDLIRHNRLFENNKIADSRVLDLCCGSGIVGIEFLSLGSKKVTFIDGDYQVLEVLNGNLATMDLNDKCDIVLQRLPKYISLENFDYIFFDPPYADNNTIEEQLKIFDLQLKEKEQMEENNPLEVKVEQGESDLPSEYYNKSQVPTEEDGKEESELLIKENSDQQDKERKFIIVEMDAKGKEIELKNLKPVLVRKCNKRTKLVFYST